MKVIIKNLQKKIPINPKRIKRAVLKALSQEGARKSGEITVCFMGDQQIKELNLLYLGCDRPTDVISFGNSVKKGQLLADIAISTDTALRNARIFKTTPQDEIHRYVIHGLLHLLGYTDNNKINKAIMQKREDSLLLTTND